MDDLEISVCDGLDQLARTNLSRHAELSNTDWTKGVKQVFVELGAQYSTDSNELPLEVATSGEQAEQTEWLFDLCWYVNHKQLFLEEERHLFKRLVLAMESEWIPARNHILGDFQKLMVARVNYRMMVFGQKDSATIEQVFGLLQHEVGSFDQSQTGDRYLFCGLNTHDSGLFEFRHYVH